MSLITYTCDACLFDFKRPVPERRCGKKATWHRDSATGREMHYCEQHKRRAINPTPEEFKPAPFSQPRQS